MNKLQTITDIPPDALAFMAKIKDCTSPSFVQASTPSGIQSLPILPGSKVVWHGVIEPNDIKWEGTKPNKPYYLVMVRRPRQAYNQRDFWWFSMDTTITVEATSNQIKGRSLPRENQGNDYSSFQ